MVYLYCKLYVSEKRRISMNNLTGDISPIVGKLSIISMKGCEEITARIDNYLKQFREDESVSTYVTHVTCPRFGTGEGKCVID